MMGTRAWSRGGRRDGSGRFRCVKSEFYLQMNSSDSGTQANS